MSNPMPDPIPASGNGELRDKVRIKFLWLTHTLTDSRREEIEQCVLDLIADSNQQAVQKALIDEHEHLLEYETRADSLPPGTGVVPSAVIEIALAAAHPHKNDNNDRR